MSFIGRLFNRQGGREFQPGKVAHPAPERRDLFGSSLFSVGPVTSQTGILAARAAENCAAICCAIQAISGAIASMPASVLREEAGGRIEAPLHPVSRLIRAPNERQAWPDLVEWLMSQTLLYGNGLIAIEFDGRGRPTELMPIPWPFVLVQLLPTGRLVYDVIAHFGPFGSQLGLPRRFLADEVIHLKCRSDDSYLGRSPLSRAYEVVEGAYGLQTHVNAMWRHGAAPSGVLTHPKSISEPARKRLRQDFDELHAGAANQRKTMLLEEGMDWKQVAVTPEAAEILQSRRFTVEEACRLYNIPPPILQEYTRNTFSNAATAGQWFAQFTLLPWVKKIEAEFARVLLSDPFHLELDMSGLMRGDYSQRWQANVQAVSNGILTANEVRQSEGYSVHADGDVLRRLPGELPGKSAPGADAAPADGPGAEAT